MNSDNSPIIKMAEFAKTGILQGSLKKINKDYWDWAFELFMWKDKDAYKVLWTTEIQSSVIHADAKEKVLYDSGQNKEKFFRGVFLSLSYFVTSY